MNKEVSGCRGCPFAYWGNDVSYCRAGNYADQDNGFFTREEIDDPMLSPNWCPLKKEPITISINPNDTRGHRP